MYQVGSSVSAKDLATMKSLAASSEHRAVRETFKTILASLAQDAELNDQDLKESLQGFLDSLAAKEEDALRWRQIGRYALIFVGFVLAAWCLMSWRGLVAEMGRWIP